MLELGQVEDQKSEKKKFKTGKIFILIRIKTKSRPEAAGFR